MLNQKKKSVLLIVLFFVITYCVLYVIGIALTPKNKELIKTYRTIESRSIFVEDNDTLDVLVVGHSGVLYGFAPMEMYDETGITSFNLARTTQSPIEAYNAIVEVLNYQSPKVIVLNVDEFTYDKADNLAKIGALDALNKVFPIFNVHTRWKYAFTHDECIPRSLTKNHCYTSTIKPIKSLNKYNKHMQPTDKVHQIIKPWKKYLDKIYNLCEEKGIGLVLMEIPTTTFWSYKRYNGFANYANEKGLTFFDFNQMEEIGIDWYKDTCDKGDHMNIYGARKVTSYMAKYLRDTYSLESHKGEEKYAIWDQELATYRAYYGAPEEV
ncbi:MAG: hypothetical protein K5923_01170 [Clostridia bacterium]|nr:hypothetical protein [Clostridia bacterium]